MKIQLYSGDQYLCDLTLFHPDIVSKKAIFHAPVFNIKQSTLNIRLENGKRYSIDKVTKGFSQDNITKDTYNARLLVDETLKCITCSHTLLKHSRSHVYQERGGMTLLECIECDCKNFKD